MTRAFGRQYSPGPVLEVFVELKQGMEVHCCAISASATHSDSAKLHSSTSEVTSKLCSTNTQVPRKYLKSNVTVTSEHRYFHSIF